MKAQLLIGLGCIAVVHAEVCVEVDTNQLSAVRGLRCPSSNWVPYRGAGANLFDVLWDAHQQRDYVSFSDATHAMDTLAAAGLRYFRMFGKLFGTFQNLWRTDPNAFWTGFDRVIRAATERHLYIILSMELGAFGELVDGEGMNALIQDSSSQSRELSRRYVRDVTSRYKNQSTILFWELTNELNIPTAIPQTRDACDPRGRSGCFDTESLALFTAEMVAEIRQLDAVRPISSGFTAPRPSAWHLEHRSSWRRDSRSQWMGMLTWQNREVQKVRSFAQVARPSPRAQPLTRVTQLALAGGHHLHPSLWGKRLLL